jgi:hypothetical protein
MLSPTPARGSIERTQRSVQAQAKPEPACLPLRIFTESLPLRPKEMFRTLVPAAPLTGVLVDFVFELLSLITA